MKVEPDLYALVFGESALNDAVAIVLSRYLRKIFLKYKTFSIVDTYSPITADAFDTAALAYACLNFAYVFFGNFLKFYKTKKNLGSLLLGSFIGCVNAVVTKFTLISEFPLLESALFILLSYSSFLLAEVVELTGIKFKKISKIKNLFRHSFCTVLRYLSSALYLQ